MIVQRSYDAEFINKVMMHPSIHPHVIDDGVEDEIDVQSTLDNKNCYWLVPEVDGEQIGFFLLHPANYVTWEIHTAILPEFRGEIAYQGARASIKWMFDNTRCQKIKANISMDNKVTIKFASKVGFKFEGISRKSFSVGGELYDEIMLGMLKEEF